MEIKEAFEKMNKGHICICVNDTYQYRIHDDQLEYKSKVGPGWDFNGSMTNDMVQSEWTLVKGTLSDKILNTSDMDIDIDVLLVEDVKAAINKIKRALTFNHYYNDNEKIIKNTPYKINTIINNVMGDKFEVD